MRINYFPSGIKCIGIYYTRGWLRADIAAGRLRSGSVLPTDGRTMAPSDSVRHQSLHRIEGATRDRKGTAGTVVAQCHTCLHRCGGHLITFHKVYIIHSFIRNI